jgi:ribonuclease-3
LNFLKPVRAHFSPYKSIFDFIKNVFGFYPGNIFLYELALRHRSASTEIKEGIRDSNERLEFLGDAILGAVITDMLFKRYPYKDEGFLTEMRSRLVSRIHLNKLAKKLGINKQLHTGRNDYSPAGSIGGDALEAIVGAIYLDKGYSFVRKIVIEVILKLHVDLDQMEHTNRNYKSLMIEWSQKEKKHLEYKVLQEVGCGNNRQYLVEILIDGEPIGKGLDFSIKTAEQAASEKACIHFGVIPNPYPENPSESE